MERRSSKYRYPFFVHPNFIITSFAQLNSVVVSATNLIIPDSAGIDRGELAEMVKQANQSVVEPKDVLTDNVFHYDRDEKKFELAMPQAEKGAFVAESGRC